MKTETREKRRSFKRDSILAAAKKILEHESFEALSMRRLAQDLEINPATVYFYFKNKEELVRELTDALYLQIAKKQRRYLQEKNPTRRLVKICTSYVRLSKQDPAMFRLLFMNPVVQNIDLEPRLTKGNKYEDPYASFTVAVKDVLEARRHDCSPAEVSRVAQIIWSLGHGAACLSTAFKGDSWFQLGSAEDLFKDGLEILLQGLGSKPKKRRKADVGVLRAHSKSSDAFQTR